jgi:hypothetical protein
MTHATRRRKAFGASSIAVAVLLSACTTTENGKVMEANVNLTRPQAQAKVIEYLTETIAALPAGAYLTRYSDLDGRVVLDPGGTVPCNDSNLSKDTSVDYGVMYFLESSDAATFQVSARQSAICGLSAAGSFGHTTPPGTRRAPKLFCRMDIGWSSTSIHAERA